SPTARASSARTASCTTRSSRGSGRNRSALEPPPAGSALQDQRGGRDILHPDPGEITHGEADLGSSTALASGRDLAELDRALELIGRVLQLAEPRALRPRIA